MINSQGYCDLEHAARKWRFIKIITKACLTIIALAIMVLLG